MEPARKTRFHFFRATETDPGDAHPGARWVGGALSSSLCYFHTCHSSCNNTYILFLTSSRHHDYRSMERLFFCALDQATTKHLRQCAPIQRPDIAISHSPLNRRKPLDIGPRQSWTGIKNNMGPSLSGQIASQTPQRRNQERHPLRRTAHTAQTAKPASRHAIHTRVPKFTDGESAAVRRLWCRCLRGKSSLVWYLIPLTPAK